MEKSKYQLNKEFYLKDILWKVLEQWKAVLLTAILIAAAVCMAKHSMDMSSYRDYIAKEKAAEEQKGLSIEERVDKITEGLTVEEKEKLEYVFQEKEWLKSQKKYQTESILIRTDPSNQRALNQVVIIDPANAEDIEILLRDYVNYVHSGTFAAAIKEQIDPETEDKYISELVTTDLDDLVMTLGSEISSHAITVSVVLTEDADAAGVSEAMTGAIKAYAGSQNKKYPHSIEFADAAETREYNAENVSKKSTVFSSINSMQKTIDDAVKTLSAQQQTALEAMELIYAESTETGASAADQAAAAAVEKPGYSKKFAILGAFLGAFMYVVMYLMVIAIRGQTDFIINAEKVTGKRTIGEIRLTEGKKGIGRLFESKLVKSLRFRGSKDDAAQIEKLAGSVEAMCAHQGITELSVINATKNEAYVAAVNDLCAALNAGRIRAAVYDAAQDIDEADFNKMRNTVLTVSDKTEMAELADIATLCAAYGVNLIGNAWVSR